MRMLPAQMEHAFRIYDIHARQLLLRVHGC